MRDLCGEVLGAYEVTSLLGAGPLASVWCARRLHGEGSLQVAIKVLTTTADQETKREKLQNGRLILEQLRHPHIARLLDGGITRQGEPFFVMEYVEGVAIDEYCQKHGLDVDCRLRLFIQVCEAVTHAHLRGVVHRDLRPGHVLVKNDGHVRILDFGIAQLVEGHAGAACTVTSGEETPAYASPEQLRGGKQSTTTDVYSLGCLLHVLLTGAHPYESALHSPPILREAVYHEPVRPPSERFANSTDPELFRRIHGDLDAVTLKALRKQPHRRYEDSAELGDEIRRYLNRFPVHARKRSSLDRATGFVRQRGTSTLVASTALVAVGLAGYLALRPGEAKFAKEQAESPLDGARRFAAESASQLVLEPTESRGRALQARAESLIEKGETAAAIDALKRAVDVWRALPGEADHPELAWSLLNLGSLLAQDGAPEGVTMMQESVAMYRRLSVRPR